MAGKHHLTTVVVHRDEEVYCEFDREWRADLPFWAASDARGKPVSRRLQAILDDLEAALRDEPYWHEAGPEVQDGARQP